MKVNLWKSLQKAICWSQYLNNKAFGNLNVPNCSSDFSGLNEFLGYENIVNSFEWKNICIKNYINPEGYDNIVCCLC